MMLLPTRAFMLMEIIMATLRIPMLVLTLPLLPPMEVLQAGFFESTSVGSPGGLLIVPKGWMQAWEAE